MVEKLGEVEGEGVGVGERALSDDKNNEVLCVTLSSVLLMLTVSLTSLVFLCDVTVLVKSCPLLPVDPFVAGKNTHNFFFYTQHQ